MTDGTLHYVLQENWKIGTLVGDFHGGPGYRHGIVVKINKRGFPNPKWWKLGVLWADNSFTWRSITDMVRLGEAE